MKSARRQTMTARVPSIVWSAPGSALLLLVVTAGVVQAATSDGIVRAFQKISNTEGGFGGNLDPADLFGTAVASLGDVDGDGITDLAVGVFGDDDGGFNTGAVWILFLNTDGTVKAEQKISDTQGGFGGELSTNAIFGVSVDGIGDLDGDGVPDLAVGNFGDDDGGLDRGAIWIVFLNTDGTVKTEQKISDTQGGFNGTLSNSDQFGSGVADVGDLDSDGVTDLAVGAWTDDDGGPDRGAIWILFLNTDGTVKSEQKISDTQGGFAGTLDNGDQFGRSVADIGDLDGDGVTDLAVGANGDDDGGPDRGAVWVLFMNCDGTVKAEQKISDSAGGFAGVLDDTDLFGWGVAGPGDLDSDGTLDLTVAARQDDDGGPNRGALWVLFMNSDGT
ncbi:MAG: FG-GAP repeat protein, partial [Planctomycetes bacterium]|nr:FG-GAP repeat protein [Planctomycetota bacterium]